MKMKNILIIDGADNCAYDVYQAEEKDFSDIFPEGRNIEFDNDFFERVGQLKYSEIYKRLWNRRISKNDVQGIHGMLFFNEDLIERVRPYWPNKKGENF